MNTVTSKSDHKTTLYRFSGPNMKIFIKTQALSYSVLPALGLGFLNSKKKTTTTCN